MLLILRSASATNTEMVRVKARANVKLWVFERLTAFAFPAIVSAEDDQKVRMSAISPSDPLVPNQWHLPLISAFESINGEDAWDLTLGRKEVIVAVIDTGVDYNHPDLLGNMWTNPGKALPSRYFTHYRNTVDLSQVLPGE